MHQMLAARGPVTGPTPPAYASLLTGRPGGTLTQFADILKFQIDHNVEGQDPDAPDSLSNPFAVVEDRTHRGFALVTDGGGNSVLRVDRKGTVHPFVVPDVVTTGACEGRPNNDPEHAGCDPVPTGIANDPWGSVYVAGLSGEAPGEGRVLPDRSSRSTTTRSAPIRTAADRARPAGSAAGRARHGRVRVR